MPDYSEDTMLRGLCPRFRATRLPNSLIRVFDYETFKEWRYYADGTLRTRPEYASDIPLTPAQVLALVSLTEEV